MIVADDVDVFSDKPLEPLASAKTFELQVQSEEGGGKTDRQWGREGKAQRGQKVRPGAARDDGQFFSLHHWRSRDDKDQARAHTALDDKLHQAANAYTIDKNAATEHEVKTKRQFRVIMNKLARGTLDKLAAKCMEIEVKSKTEFETIIAEIFDIALRQPFLCDLYAELCAYIARHQDVFVDRIVNVVHKTDDGGGSVSWHFHLGVVSTDETGPEMFGPYASEAEAKAEAKKKTAFKRILLSKTKQEFDRKVDLSAFSNEVAWDTLSEEETATEKIRVARASRDAKKRMLGNIKLISELFRQQMLSLKVMHQCLTALLSGEIDNPDESYIECSINLLRSVGELIDVGHGKEYVTGYFERLEILGGAASPLSTRVRFMCQDICETRRNRWKARHKEQRTMTKEEVRAAAAREEADKREAAREAARESARGGRRENRHDNRRDDRRRGGGDVQRGGSGANQRRAARRQQQHAPKGASRAAPSQPRRRRGATRQQQQQAPKAAPRTAPKATPSRAGGWTVV